MYLLNHIHGDISGILIIWQKDVYYVFHNAGEDEKII